VKDIRLTAKPATCIMFCVFWYAKCHPRLAKHPWLPMMLFNQFYQLSFVNLLEFWSFFSCVDHIVVVLWLFPNSPIWASVLWVFLLIAVSELCWSLKWQILLQPICLHITFTLNQEGLHLISHHFICLQY